MLRRAGFWLADCAFLFVLWELFVDKLEGHEIAVGLMAAALAAAGTELVRGIEQPRFFPQTTMLAQAWRVPAMLLEGCWVLVQQLFRRISGDRSPGVFRVIRFEAGGEGPRAATRRALAVVYSTLPPNSLVIDIDRNKNILMLHQVRLGRIPAILNKLGRRP